MEHENTVNKTVTPSPALNEVAANAAPARASLRQRVLQSGTISVLGFGTSQAIRLASNLIMTRLLTSDAFGLMAITISMQVMMIMISDVGINTSVIRSPSSSDTRFLSTAWVTQIFRGILIALVMLTAAGVIALMANRGAFSANTVFADPRLPIFLMVIALSGLLEGVRSIKMVLCQRDLKMERLIVLEIAAQISAVATMIGAYFLGAGAYSLVIGALMATMLTTIGTHIFLKGPPIPLAFDKTYFWEIFSFGKWLVIASFAAFVSQRGDHFIFGAIMPRDDYGYYAIATIWITVVILLVDMIQTRIVYTSFAEVWRERKQDLTKVYYKFRTGFDIICLTIFVGILTLSDLVFNVLYPDEYGSVTFYLKLLAIIILLLPYRLLNSALLAEGKSRNFMLVTLAPVIMMIVGTPIVYHFTNLKTAIVFSAVSQVPTVPISWYFTKSFLNHSMVRELPMLLLALSSAVLIVIL